MQTVSRLYPSFQPSHYKVHLNLNREGRTFDGNVSVEGHTNGGTELRLHAKDLTIKNVVLNGSTSGFKIENDEIVITPDSRLENSAYTIKIDFSGKVTDPMHGLYPCYFEHEGKKKELLATQFESHHAREVFPCIDEPEAKATFDVTLITETGIEVLGNMPVKDQVEKSGKLTTTFETSPKMSTYLLAFVVGEMQSKEMTTKGGVLVRTWATKAQTAESLDFALKHAADTIDFFDEYFGVPYPLPKSDNVALPDFSAGAMENWGLITYRETTLLVDPKNTSISSKQYVAGVITHEVSHQWFGNLVTMKWWDDLWLNESFASLMEYVGVDALYPDWDVWLDFGPNDRAPALHRDMLTGVQAIRTDVNHPDEISTLFDPSIVYAKGASVLNMVKNYIGETAFKNGLRRYFETHKYGNTSGSDLWAAFGIESNHDITGFMNAWVEKPGYPVVHINQNGKNIQLAQQRLLSNAVDKESLWPIPLFAEPALDVALLEDREQAVTTIDKTYRLLNLGSNSVFVTHYVTQEHRKHLANQLAQGILEPADRLRLLHDSLLLARTGEQSLDETLALALRSDNEKRDAVWDSISMIIADTRRFVEHDKKLEQSLKHRVQTLIAPLLGELGLEAKDGDSEETIKLRTTIFGLGVWCEHEDALAYALEQFENFTKPDELDADARGIIYAAGARWRGEPAYEKLFNLYKASQFAEERQLLAGGLAATRNLDVIKKLLSHIKNPDIVRSQDIAFWFVYMMRKHEARDLAWQWLVSEWGWIEKKFGGDKSYDYFPRYASGALFGDEWLKKYKDFFEPKLSQPVLKRVITVGIIEITSRTAWFERDESRLRSFLS